jgi:cell division protein FtsI/penicillin-binding protein 2
MQKKINHFLNFLIIRLSAIDRVRIVFFAFAIFAFIIIWTTFKYTVLEYTYYKGLADKQQMVTVKNPVSRGTIYSNNEPAGVFATSTDLSDLAIDPKEVGSKEKLESFLTDVVFEDICSQTIDDRCTENLFNYLKQVQDEDLIATEESVKNKIHEDIHRKISKEFIDSVIIKESLNEKEINDLKDLTE